MNKPGNQRGLSFSGFIFGALCLVLVMVFGLKLIPPYIQHAEINKLLSTIANDPDMQKAPIRDIRASFNRRASIDNITAVKADDIDIDTSAEKPVLTASYAVKIPLAGNVSLYIDFNSASK
ncbi:MAG: DUF4845 domain-containing protein [Proteobacteria bacterium]|nr:DUF4845 domain-containing protein [Pseudomonadota bacterium]